MRFVTLPRGRQMTQQGVETLLGVEQNVYKLCNDIILVLSVITTAIHKTLLDYLSQRLSQGRIDL